MSSSYNTLKNHDGVTSPAAPNEIREWMRSLKQGKLLRYKIDFFSVLVVLSACVLQFVAYWYRWPWYSLAIVPILILIGIAHLVEHNHSHLPIFKYKWLNEFLGWLMFLNCGVPLQVYREQHVRVHHGEFATSRDWTSPWAFQGTEFPTKPISKLYYILSFMPIAFGQCLIIFLRKPNSRSTLYFIISVIIVGFTVILLASHDYYYFLLYYLVPWFVIYWHLPKANWGHHINCAHDSVYTIAINDFSFHGKTLGFNIGYHTAHHWVPHLHWSLLPKFHEIYLARHVPPEYYTSIVASMRDSVNEI